MQPDTANLSLPLLAAAQSQKHVTHNEALDRLDAVVQLSVRSRAQTAPPDAPAEGERYIVPSPAGSWPFAPHAVAVARDGTWSAAQPREGWLCWVEDEDRLLVHRNGAWSALEGDGGPERVERLGIATDADDTNRLAVASPATLLSHGGDDHRLVVNKAASGDTASLVFQTDFSGRAEFGTAGSDAFSVKVSADGAEWNEALRVDGADGAVTMPNTVLPGSRGPFGVPDDTDGYDVYYLNADTGDDANDARTANGAVRTFERLFALLTVGRRVEIRLMSDVVCDRLISLSYPIAGLSIQGRNAADTGYERRRLTVVDADNSAFLCGSMLLRCISSVELRNLHVDLASVRARPFVHFYYTLGYFRTYDVIVSRSDRAAAFLFGNSNSFVANHHLLLDVQAGAEGNMAQGMAAGGDPNATWNMPSNVTSF